MTLSRANFEFIRKLLSERSAIVLDDGKRYLVESRLGPVARQAGCPSIDDLVRRIRAAPDDSLHQQLIDALTTKETSFYRDKIPFEKLREEILPDLIQRRAHLRRLNFWSAGCAGGQEVYSLAMLLREHFCDLPGWNFYLLGSDLSTAALQKARGGRFTDVEVERGLPPTLLNKYFRRANADWQLVESIRSMVEFRQINLHGQWPPLPAMDIVLLRNVLVYFDQATRNTVLRRVRQVLRPDGYLLLGGAESAVHFDDTFTAVRGDGFSYYRPKT